MIPRKFIANILGPNHSNFVKIRTTSEVHRSNSCIFRFFDTNPFLDKFLVIFLKFRVLSLFYATLQKPEIISENMFGKHFHFLFSVFVFRKLENIVKCVVNLLLRPPLPTALQNIHHLRR